jgi:hypothetical protein
MYNLYNVHTIKVVEEGGRGQGRAEEGARKNFFLKALF